MKHGKIHEVLFDGFLCGNKVSAYWNFGETLNVVAHGKEHTVPITAGLQNRLQTLFEEKSAKRRNP